MFTQPVSEDKVAPRLREKDIALIRLLCNLEEIKQSSNYGNVFPRFVIVKL